MSTFAQTYGDEGPTLTPNAFGLVYEDAINENIADLITQPLLIIAGEIADSRYMSEEAFAKATSTADKELFIVPGATHIRTYFVKEYVDQISAKIQQFYTTNWQRKNRDLGKRIVGKKTILLYYHKSFPVFAKDLQAAFELGKRLVEEQ